MWIAIGLELERLSSTVHHDHLIQLREEFLSAYPLSEQRVLEIMGPPDTIANQPGADDIRGAGHLKLGQKDFWWRIADSDSFSGVRIDAHGWCTNLFDSSGVLKDSVSISKDASDKR